MPPLATKDDVQGLLGRDLTPAEDRRIGKILEKLSELFRNESWQHFTPGESHSRLKVNGGEVYLPQRPVVAVEEVTTVDGRPVEFHLHGQWLSVPSMTSSQMVLVKYSHGSADVPALVVDTIADAARQILEIDPAAISGRTQEQETTGPMTVSNSYATWAQGGSTRLSPADEAVARSFRARLGNVWVG